MTCVRERRPCVQAIGLSDGCEHAIVLAGYPPWGSPSSNGALDPAPAGFFRGASSRSGKRGAQAPLLSDVQLLQGLLEHCVRSFWPVGVPPLPRPLTLSPTKKEQTSRQVLGGQIAKL
jgi:hypothetical protein